MNEPALTHQDRDLIADALRAYADEQRRTAKRRSYIGPAWARHRENFRDRAARAEIIALWLDTAKPRFLR